jgi:GntR family transcriptional regulator
MIIMERTRRQIEAQLRRDIDHGIYPPGAVLPSAVDLAEEYGVGKSTIDTIYNTLQDGGLVVRTKRRGTVVKVKFEIILHDHRYSSPTRGPWEDACAEAGMRGRTRVIGVSKRPADKSVANAFGVPLETPMIHRLSHMEVENLITQIQQTWFLPSLVDGTELAAPGGVKGGIYKGLTRAGHKPAVADSTIESRMPTPDEAELLCLGPGSPVQEVRRTTKDHEGSVIVYVHLVVAADRVKLATRRIL